MSMESALFHIATALGETRDEFYGALLVVFAILLFFAVEAVRSR